MEHIVYYIYRNRYIDIDIDIVPFYICIYMVGGQKSLKENYM